MDPVGDIAPREDEGRWRRTGGSQVIAAGVDQDFVVVGEVIENHRLAGIQTPNVIGEQRVPDAWHGLHHPATDQFLARHTEVVTRCLVDVTVEEIDDLAGGIPRRFQAHLRIKQ